MVSSELATGREEVTLHYGQDELKFCRVEGLGLRQVQVNKVQVQTGLKHRG